MGLVEAALALARHPSLHTSLALLVAIAGQLHHHWKVDAPSCALECATAVSRAAFGGQCCVEGPPVEVVCPLSQHDVLVRVSLGLGGVLGVLAVAACHLSHKLFWQRPAAPELRIDECGLLEVGKRRSSSGGGPLHHLSVDAGYW